MPDQKVIWLLLVTLAQAVLIGLKIIEFLSKKKDKEPASSKSPNLSASNPHPCQQHGERIAKLEASLEAFKEDNRDEHAQLRENISRVFKILNGARK